MGEKENNSYEDIINMEHHVSDKHPHMSVHDRAAQFSAFAALTGHDEAIKETERLTRNKIELEEEVKERLDEKFKIIMRSLEAHPVIKITYFMPDEKKQGGKYVEEESTVVKIDTMGGIIYTEGGKEIHVSDICEMEGEIFEKYY